MKRLKLGVSREPLRVDDNNKGESRKKKTGTAKKFEDLKLNYLK